MNVSDVADGALDRLESEIRVRRNRISNAVSTRDSHPTYGVTKGKLRKELDQLMGLLDAWLIITGHWPHGASPMWYAETYKKVSDELDIHVLSLEEMVR